MVSIGMIGNTTRDSRPRSWNTVLSAATRRRSRPIASPVLGLTSNRGKFELEDGRRPLSDLALAAALRQRGFVLARRTVAKYRGELAIPPCHRRIDRPGVMLRQAVSCSIGGRGPPWTCSPGAWSGGSG